MSVYGGSTVQPAGASHSTRPGSSALATLLKVSSPAAAATTTAGVATLVSVNASRGVGMRSDASGAIR